MRSRLDAWIEAQEGVFPRTRDDIEAIQLRKLNRVLKRLRAGGRFYASLPGRLESLEQLQSLPFTTEQDIIARGARMLAVSQSEVARITSDTTSGTTGHSKRLYYTQADRDRTVSFFACGIGEFVSAGDTVVIAMPFSGEEGLGDLIAKAIRDLGARPVELGIGKTYGEMLDALERFHPAAYIGFPVPLLSLLRVAKAWGCDMSPFADIGSAQHSRTAKTEGDAGHPLADRSLVQDLRAAQTREHEMPLQCALVSADASAATVTSCTERLLGSKLFPHYGSREIGLGGAITCSAHAGMHIRENDIIAEIVDGNGNPLPDGKEGELVVTTIGAEAMPLIRYRTGDRARIIEGACPCGSVIRRLDGVERMTGGVTIAALDEQLFTVDPLVDYRVSKDEDEVAIEALVLEDIGADLKAKAQEVFPECKISLSSKLVTPDDQPSYIAKRHWRLPEGH